MAGETQGGTTFREPRLLMVDLGTLQRSREDTNQVLERFAS